MKRYFKHEAESDLDAGVAYLEFEGEWAIHQVEKYNDRWFCSNKEYHPEIGPTLADQPLSEMEFKPEYEISSEEFEGVWEEAMKHCE
jgi:hypothetical protein